MLSKSVRHPKCGLWRTAPPSYKPAVRGASSPSNKPSLHLPNLWYLIEVSDRWGMSSVRLLSWPLVLLCAVLVLLVFPAAAATATGVAQSATGLDLAGLAILSPLNHSVVPAPNVRLQLDVMVFSAAGPDLERVMRSSLHYQVDGLPAVKCTECWELPWVPLHGLEPHDHCVAGEGGGGTTGIAWICTARTATAAREGLTPKTSAKRSYMYRQPLYVVGPRRGRSLQGPLLFVQ